MTNLFNDRALKRLHKVGDQSGPITLLSPPLKATLYLGVVIAIGGGLWATFARIPFTVNGTGVLLPVGAITNSVSLSDGIAIWMVGRPPTLWQQQAWNFKQNSVSFDDQSMAQLANSILKASESAVVSSDAIALGSALSLQRYRGSRFPRGRLLVWVQNSSQKGSLASSVDQLERTIRSGNELTNKILVQIKVLRSQYDTRLEYLKDMKKLEVPGYVSRDNILGEQSTLDSISAQILSNQNQLIELKRLRNVAYQDLRNQLALFINQQFVFADNDVYLNQANALNGEEVTRGRSLLKLSDQPLQDTSLVPVFIGSNEAAQVRLGMKVLATPAGYKRSEFGGIRGQVAFKAALPGTLETVTARVGVESIAQQIIARAPSPTLLMVSLEKANRKIQSNSGGYLWSTNSNLPFAPIPGERLDVEITTRSVPPIEMILPSLRRWFGLTPPDLMGQSNSVNQ